MENKKTELQRAYEMVVDAELEAYTDNMITEFENTPYAEYVDSFGYGDQLQAALKLTRQSLKAELENWDLDDAFKAYLLNGVTAESVRTHCTIELNTNYRIDSDDILYVSMGEEEIDLDYINAEFMKTHNLTEQPEFMQNYGYYPLHEYSVALRFDAEAYVNAHESNPNDPYKRQHGVKLAVSYGTAQPMSNATKMRKRLIMAQQNRGLKLIKTAA